MKKTYAKHTVGDMYSKNYTEYMEHKRNHKVRHAGNKRALMRALKLMDRRRRRHRELDISSKEIYEAVEG